MKIYPNEINLQSHNRYNEKVSLEQIKGNTYKFISDSPYIRCTFKENNITIEAIDPSGGPYLNIGYAVTPTLEVKHIAHSIEKQCFVITLKQISK